jgi:hypothetical protein
MDERKILTPEQLAIQQEICANARSHCRSDQLRRRPTRIRSSITRRSAAQPQANGYPGHRLLCHRSRRRDKRVTVKCTITLPDGRTRAVEVFSRARRAASRRENDRIRCRSPSMLRGRVHRVSGSAASASISSRHIRNSGRRERSPSLTRAWDPRKPIYDEIHAAATDLALIVNGDKSAYRQFIAETFEGVVSAKDLSSR